MAWGEFVHISATYFKLGEYPWTQEDFYNNSLLQSEASATVAPIVQTIFAHEGPRVAEDNGWWEGWVWSSWLDVGDDCRLKADAVRFEFWPITIGTGDKDAPPRSLIAYEVDGMGMADTFAHELDALKALCDARVGEKSFVSLLTLWSCEAGFSYVPGEPSEYESDWQLIGAVDPKADGAVFVLCPEPEGFTQAPPAAPLAQ